MDLFKQLRRGNPGDAIFKGLAVLFGLSLLFISGLVVFELWYQSSLSRGEFGWSVLWSTEWDPPGERFGALQFIYGTLVTALGALLLAGPIGIGIAAFLVEIAPRRVDRVVGIVVETLAAVPSVVYGLWGIFVLGPFLCSYVAPPLQAVLGWLPLFSGPCRSYSVFTATFILAIMILPTVAAISRDVIRAVPDAQREAMLALGATRWEMFSRAVLPYAKSGIVGAFALALGRAAGETMALAIIIGNAPRIFTSLFDQGATMASIIAANFANAGSAMFVSFLIELGLILFAITLIINVSARLLVWTVASGPSGGIRA
ncbi:phosphate ABC transporter permease subunit PstC [Rubrobacter taiwanensis]|jgi:phosphate transport system permease protein|uniref:Phosphate transport system permease protein n=1 Tax=Rubrobacter taiwanensis TaxID=185139 RepID=A0A4R1BLX6_9ACTN|nr:phosphate ABC transporter permease subunit PstC [Rubrobacter taiwanensis]TCJ18337.1 phosphate ABC transporter permease subunit PstC [Rubrobacter taiwanensis]